MRIVNNSCLLVDLRNLMPANLNPGQELLFVSDSQGTNNCIIIQGDVNVPDGYELVIQRREINNGFWKMEFRVELEDEDMDLIGNF